MKDWKAPAMEELDVRLTAQGQYPCTVETDRTIVDGIVTHPARYDSTLYEADGENSCGGNKIIKKKSTVES